MCINPLFTPKSDCHTSLNTAFLCRGEGYNLGLSVCRHTTLSKEANKVNNEVNFHVTPNIHHIQRLTNPLATPVLEEPPPPPSNTWRLVSICKVYRGKLTRANNPSCFLRVGAIILETFPRQHTLNTTAKRSSFTALWQLARPRLRQTNEHHMSSVWPHVQTAHQWI
jgi:hypothetical protein